MQFSDTSNKQGLIQDIDFILFGSSATQNTDYSIADRTRNINAALDEITGELYKADPNYMWDDFTNTDFPIAYMNMTADLDHYTILDSSQVIHRVRMKDRSGKWKTLTPRARRELTDEQLESTGEPDYYYKIDNAIFPVGIPDYGATNGVELEFQRGANHFSSSDTTAKPGFNPQYHRFLSISAALDYAIANGHTKKIAQLRADKEAMRARVREHYQLRSPDERPKLRLRSGSARRYGM